MRLFSLIVGTEKQADGRRIKNPAQRLGKIRRLLANIAGGYTEVQTFGGWRDSTGRLVTERGRRFDVLATGRAARRLRDVPKIAARLLNQESVIAAFIEYPAHFVGQ